MDAILTSLIAVLGTLLGSLLTHVFQVRSNRRAEWSARAEQHRQERIEAFGAYAGVLVEFRQAALHHWHCIHQGTDAAEEPVLRGRSYEARSRAQHALFRVQLTARTPEIGELAAGAFEEIGRIDQAADLAGLIDRRDATRVRIDEFVTAAREQL
ncbi:hypothetical protein ACIRBX_18950 [Kitasatospora sp. NPDC096147]|uniref:hypothetical protein n=1 Tax=Kitasatospora sp. NPDC096147 TaxID=3364093 RepID=UPI00381C3369